MVVNKVKSVVILSGGMDSTTLLYDIVSRGHDVHALSFDYGQKHVKELECAKATCVKLKVSHEIIDLKVLGEIAPSSLTRKNVPVPEGDYKDENMKLTVVPNRNMVLLSLATAYAIGIGAKLLFYGAHAGDHAIYPDCRPEFVNSMAKTIKLADWSQVSLQAPYLKMDKGAIAILGKELGVDYSLTWTCYKGGEKACGVCGACRERLEAFAKAGIRDPIDYDVGSVMKLSHSDESATLEEDTGMQKDVDELEVKEE